MSHGHCVGTHGFLSPCQVWVDEPFGTHSLEVFLLGVSITLPRHTRRIVFLSPCLIWLLLYFFFCHFYSLVFLYLSTSTLSHLRAPEKSLQTESYKGIKIIPLTPTTQSIPQQKNASLSKMEDGRWMTDKEGKLSQNNVAWSAVLYRPSSKQDLLWEILFLFTVVNLSTLSFYSLCLISEGCGARLRLLLWLTLPPVVHTLSPSPRIRIPALCISVSPFLPTHFNHYSTLI